MALDPRVKRFLDLLAASNPPDALEQSVERRRAALVELMGFGGTPAPSAGVEDRFVGSPASRIPVRVFTPEGAQQRLPGLIYFHGGGLVAGSIATHEGIARGLAHAGACRVVSVGYRLAPEHPFPAALADADAAIREIRLHAAGDFGIDPARVGVCGDSAGATLVAASCHAAAPLEAPPLALQLLLCPILDYSRRSASRREFAAGYLVDQATLDHDLLHYAPDRDPADPRISPLRAERVDAVPPTVIHTAEFDPLRDEGRLYFERLQTEAPDSALAYHCHPGMIHLFYGLGGVIPYARTAMAEIGRQIRSALNEDAGRS